MAVKTPNIIMMSDDVGAWNVSAYIAGN